MDLLHSGRTLEVEGNAVTTIRWCLLPRPDRVGREFHAEGGFAADQIADAGLEIGAIAQRLALMVTRSCRLICRSEAQSGLDLADDREVLRRR